MHRNRVAPLATALAITIAVALAPAGAALGAPATSGSVGLASFKAAATKGVVTVSWKSANETAMLGFNVYRTDAKGASRKLNVALIAAKHTGQPTGGAYKYLDKKAKKGLRYTYKLQILDPQGGKIFFGNAKVLAR